MGTESRHFLDVIAPFLSPALVSSDALARLRAISDPLPDALLTRVALECRLAAGADQVDFGLGLFEAERKVLAAPPERHRFLNHLCRRPEWERVRNAAYRWAQRSDDFDMEGFWFGFIAVPTVAGPGPWAPAPVVYLDLGDLRLPDISTAACHERACRFLSFVRGERMTETETENLRRCFDALPTDAQINFIGHFFSGGVYGCRVCVARLEESEIGPYLADVGWPGSWSKVSEMLEHIPRPAVYHQGPALLHIDVGAATGRSVGLEYKLDDRNQVETGLVERDLLDYLTEHGFCTPAKRDALLSWPGVTTANLPSRRGPEHLGRIVNSVKLYYADGSLSAKAYLYTRFLPVAEQHGGVS